MTNRSDLRPIAVVDIRDGGPVRYARDAAARARALRDDCLAWFPALAAPLLPVLDRLARHWLRRARSPYVAEIEAIAATLGFPGIWFLNGSYQWGCTALAREEGGMPWLARTLDWPFPGLGRHAEIARMCGSAGEFFSITWPGYVGVLTGMAPGRFAAAINQAPLWRRTRHPWLRIYDISANAVNTWRRIRHIPPDQLLRSVFEDCGTFADARRQLETTPIARPVIFTLAGSQPSECCVIERTEESYTTRCDATVAANDWHTSLEPWEARVGGDMVMRCTFAEAMEGSRARCEALAGWNGSFAHDSFGWVAAPVLNRYTRLAVEMCAASATLRVVGYEHRAGNLAEPATEATTPRLSYAA
jgi:hypothetical protein